MTHSDKDWSGKKFGAPSPFLLTRSWRLKQGFSTANATSSLLTLHGQDAISPAGCTKGLPVYAGYYNGFFTNIAAFKADFPSAIILSITPNGRQGARCIDCEPGDATAAQAAQFVKDNLPLAPAGGRNDGGKPIIYCSAGDSQAVINAVSALGISRSQWILWSAHWIGQHICSPSGCGYPQADATQYASNNAFDSDLFYSYCFGTVAPPSNPTLPLKQGDVDVTLTGPVHTLQRNINKWISAFGGQLGINLMLTADGNYGPLTAAAVTAAQVFLGQRGVTAGVCDQALFNDLAAAPPFPTPPPVPTPPPPPVPVPTPPPPVPSTMAEKVAKMMAVMQSKVGEGYTEVNPDRFGTTVPQKFDCSGLVWYAANQAGIPMPGGPSNIGAALVPYEMEWAGSKLPGAALILNPADVQAGDLVAFTGAGPAPFPVTVGTHLFPANLFGHIGMAVSATEYVSAYDTAEGVKVKPISGDVFNCAVRMQGISPVPPPPASPFPLKQGSTGTMVKTLQQNLVKWGFATAIPTLFPVDSNFGPLTTAAVTLAQAHFKNTAAKGECDQALYGDLAAALPPPSAPAWGFAAPLNLKLLAAGRHSVKFSFAPAPQVHPGVTRWQVAVCKGKKLGPVIDTYPRYVDLVPGQQLYTQQFGGLSPVTTYTLAVRAQGAEGAHSSEWASFTFTTPA
jgi:cell wall-associated NlpC family hydrolase